MYKVTANNSFGRAQYSVFAQKSRQGLGRELTIEMNLKGREDDAVKVSLSKNAKEAASAADAALQPKQEGYIVGALKQIAGVSKRISDLKKTLETGALTDAQRQATETEITNLSTEYSSIVGSDQYHELLRIVDAVNQGIQSGQDPRKFYKTLASQRGLLGDDILGLIQHGTSFNLGVISGSLSTLGSADLSNVLNDGSVLGTISSAVNTAWNALSGPDVQTTQTAPVAAEVIKTLPNEINPQVTSFVGPDDVTLSLRSFSTDDLLTAALNGLDIGPVSVLTLTTKPDKDSKTDEKLNS